MIRINFEADDSTRNRQASTTTSHIIVGNSWIKSRTFSQVFFDKEVDMARYKKYEHLPWWLNNLNDNTLTPTQKEVLDLDYYCQKYGTKLSHKRAADKLDRGRQTVYTARRRLEELGLRTTEPAKGSFKLGHPIEYQNEAEFLDQLRAKKMSLGRSKMERKSSRESKDLRLNSLSQLSKEAGKKPAGDLTSGANPPNPLTTFCSVEAAEDQASREVRNELMRDLNYQDALDKQLKLGHSQEKAERIARTRANELVDRRTSERNQQQKT